MLNDDFSREVKEFHEKNELFRFGYERGLSELEFHEINFDLFINYLFVRKSIFDEPFEEIMSQEYQIWRKQSGKAKKDYSQYRYFRYNPIIFSKEGDKNIHRILLKDDIETSNWVAGRKFAIMPPATFVGRNNTNVNARHLYAIAIDLDGVTPEKLEGFFRLASSGMYCQIPNILVNSGHGLHVYFLLKEPVSLCDPNTWKLMQKLKENITLLIWQKSTSTIPQRQAQLQPILQAFRLPGTLTKFGEKITAWEVSGTREYTIEELNALSSPEYALTASEIASIGVYPYNPDKITLEEAKRRFPAWYEHRVVKKKRSGRTWSLKRGIYDWWLAIIRKPKRERLGHRYWCIFMLFVYAAKGGVPKEEVEADAMALIPSYELISGGENPFTEEDVKAASKGYEQEDLRFSISRIERLTAERIVGQRRNGRPQSLHLMLARAARDAICKYHGKEDWREGNGRPKATTENSEHFAKVQQWRRDNPECTNKSKCSRELNLDRKTVRKWWDA